MAHLRAALGDLLPVSDGWAVTALQQSIRRTVLLATMIWQPIMVGAAFSDLGFGATVAILTILHLGFVVLARATERRRLPEWILVALLYLVCIIDFVASTGSRSPLLFATCWLLVIAAVATTLIVPGRRAIILGVLGPATIVIGVRLLRPEWSAPIPYSFAFTCITVLFVARLGLPLLLGFGDRVDRASAEVEQERLASAVAAAAQRETAENARVLHDTAVNTLGAIANGGAAILDVGQVRLRCARDLATIQELRASDAERSDRWERLSDMYAGAVMPIERSGLDDEALDELGRALPAETVRAMVRSARELVGNAAKHSGAWSVEIDAHLEDERLVVTIADRGRGFDGRIPGDRGLANSVMARCAEVGIAFEIDTAPGMGTRAVLRADAGTRVATERDEAEDGAPRGSVAAEAERMQRSAGWVWMFGMVAVGIVIEAVNRFGEPSAAYFMLLVVVCGSILGWSLHARFSLHRFGATFFVLAAVVAFLLSAAAVDFGLRDPFHWQVIGPTGPIIVLSTLNPGRRMMMLGYAAYVLTALLLALAMLPMSSDAAAIVIIAGVAGVGLMVAWESFQHTNRMIAESTVADRQRVLALRIERDARNAAEESQLRWLTAGLEDSAALLSRIASGEVAPGDTAVREACAAEEAYLRQLTQLSPEAVYFGRWASAALREGRVREIKLELRTGDADAPDTESARLLGETLLATVDSVPGGTMLRATLFPLTRGVQLTIVGPGGSLAAMRAHEGPISAVSYRALGGQDLLEIPLVDAR